MHWIIRDRALDLSTRALVMGIVNVTPDSFSDGGRFVDPEAAIAHGLELVAQGADLLDVGGESTRPGSHAVSLDEERRRVVPVIAGLAQRTRVPISVDTSKAALADEALAVGAHVVNDVTAGGDPDMVAVVARWGAGIVLMHMRGTPATMQDDPHYVNVVAEIADHLEERVARFEQGTVSRQRMVLDPGIGFGKTSEHNLEIVVRLHELRRLGLPVCLGVSRKGFLGAITQRPRHDRGVASAALACYCLARKSVDIVRVHDVPPHRDAVLMLAALHAAEAKCDGG